MTTITRRGFFKGAAGAIAVAAVPAVLIPEKRFWQVGEKLGDPLVIRAQGCTGTATTGGSLVLRPGTGIGFYGKPPFPASETGKMVWDTDGKHFHVYDGPEYSRPDDTRPEEMPFGDPGGADEIFHGDHWSNAAGTAVAPSLESLRAVENMAQAPFRIQLPRISTHDLAESESFMRKLAGG